MGQSWSRVKWHQPTNPLAAKRSYQLSINLDFSLLRFWHGQWQSSRGFPLAPPFSQDASLPGCVIWSHRMCQPKAVENQNQMLNEDGAFSKRKLTAGFAGDWLDNFLISVRALSSCWEVAFAKKICGKLAKGLISIKSSYWNWNFPNFQAI